MSAALRNWPRVSSVADRRIMELSFAVCCFVTTHAFALFRGMGPVKRLLNRNATHTLDPHFTTDCHT